MNTTETEKLTNLYISCSRPDNLFEEKYINARRKEHRLFEDWEVQYLPIVSKMHPHHKEWSVRKRSCQRLIKHLEAQKRSLQILEIGCGNGWLSQQLSTIPGSKVIGSDINLMELQQAVRVFCKNSKLKFVYGDIRSGMLDDMNFDVIIFASSIQYFPTLEEILFVSLSHLNPNGEIHILDSPIYREQQIESAKYRSREYFTSIGSPEMSNFYFHHSYGQLSPFNYKLLTNPNSLANRLFLKIPFPWICIRNV